jgi:hypothetical protein
MRVEDGAGVAALIAFRLPRTETQTRRTRPQVCLTEDALRAPSPLNGERAGVRGENDDALTLRRKLRCQKP